MALYISQDLFNEWVLRILFLHFNVNLSIEMISSQFADSYKRSLSDKNLSKEFFEAGTLVKQHAIAALPESSNVERAGLVCHWLYCQKWYTLDGRRKRQRLLNGLLFTCKWKPVENKARNCYSCMVRYEQLMASGTIPFDLAKIRAAMDW